MIRRDLITPLATAFAVAGCGADTSTPTYGSATRLAFQTQPASTGAGQPLSPKVEIRDAQDRLVANATLPVTVSLNGNASMAGQTTVNAVGGIATFSGLFIVKAGTGYSLTASSASLTAATSVPFDISTGPPAKLVFMTAPADAGVRWSSFVPTVEVGIEDNFGNAAASASNQVTIALGNAAGATLQGTATRAATAGVATFADLRVDRPGAGYVLTAGGAALTGVTSSPFTVRLGTVSVGDFYACGLNMTGQAYCWGLNHAGELGDGTKTDRNVPVPVAGGLTFASIFPGRNHTCAVTAAGQAYCWGRNGNGQLGDGTMTERLTPVAVAGGLVFSAVEPGQLHTCGLTTTGQAYCWGLDEGGTSLGNGPAGGSTTPTPVAGGLLFSSISTRFVHSCALTPAGLAYCWGSGTDGRLGDGTTTSRDAPTLVAGGLTFSAITVGGQTSCGLTAAGAAWCWGLNGTGTLGDGTTTSSSVPVAVTGGLVFASVVGGAHTCGLTRTGVGYCWGLNGDGELGDNTTTNRLVPTAITGGLRLVSLSAGVRSSCGVTVAGAAWCWGLNSAGEVGDGTNTTRLVPTLVSGGIIFQ